jgi:transposase
VPWTVTEHRAHAYYCPRCRQVHYAPLPAEVERGGMLGPKLMALIAYLKGMHHASFSTIRQYFRDVLKLPISRGRLAKAVQQVSQSLRTAHEELRGRLVEQPTLRVDETGHHDQGRRHWTWCFRAEAFTWFHIDATRSSQVLLDVLGEQFAGVLGCDYFSAYRKYMGECDVLVQFCLAHLIRDLKYLTTLPQAATAAYGRRLLEQVRALFQVIHDADARRHRRGRLAATLRRISRRIIRIATTAVPASREAQAMATRFRKHGRAYFQFITTPGIEPTNNLAEQALRFVVIDRRITQGTRGEKGQRWCERIWTVLATCAQQGRNALQFLIETTIAWGQGLPPPSLLPAPAAS